MLRFVRSLRLSSNLKAAELSAVATEIYQRFFIKLGAASEQFQLPLCHDFDVQNSNQNGVIPSSDADVWIFGYGSLVWKADFPYIDRRRGYICGYKRRFYQHSIDHRGVPEKPGRVVTLLPGDAVLDRVYGVAYRIAFEQKHDVLNHLDYREKNGYERCSLNFYEYPKSDDGPATPIEVIMYVATAANDSYAGDVWQVPRIAEQIFTSAGPSGPNRDYLFNLAKAMCTLFPGAVDEHLSELVDCVQHYIQVEEPILLQRALCKEIVSILSECLSSKPPLGTEAIVLQLELLLDHCSRPGCRELLLTKELEAKHASDIISS